MSWVTGFRDRKTVAQTLRDQSGAASSQEAVKRSFSFAYQEEPRRGLSVRPAALATGFGVSASVDGA